MVEKMNHETKEETSETGLEERKTRTRDEIERGESDKNKKKTPTPTPQSSHHLLPTYCSSVLATEQELTV